MAEKQNKDLSNKVDKIMSERNQLRDLKKAVLKDTSTKQQTNQLKKLEFLDSNQALIEDKMQGIKKQNEDKYLDQMNYFPFTHGDAIEKQRKEIGEREKIELNEKFASRESQMAKEKEFKKEINKQNKMKVEARVQMMHEAVKKDEDDMLNQFSEIDVARQQGIEVDEEKQRLTNAKVLVPSFPAYTKSTKKQNQ